MKNMSTSCKMRTVASSFVPLALLGAALLFLIPGLCVGSEELNAPPEGFAALFNGKDFTGWRLSPMAKRMWSVEGGVLRSHLPLEEDYGDLADIETESKYRDFVLLADYRMATPSDSGISFRGFEQLNLNAGGGGWMGHLMSWHFPLDRPTVKEHPQVRRINPEVGVWHTVKLTVIGKTVTVEYDGEIIIDRFEYPEGISSTEPGVIKLQKHMRIDLLGDGRISDCPVEFRNVFIKELGTGTVDRAAEGK